MLTFCMLFRKLSIVHEQTLLIPLNRRVTLFRNASCSYSTNHRINCSTTVYAGLLIVVLSSDRALTSGILTPVLTDLRNHVYHLHTIEHFRIIFGLYNRRNRATCRAREILFKAVATVQKLILCLG